MRALTLSRHAGFLCCGVMWVSDECLLQAYALLVILSCNIAIIIIIISPEALSLGASGMYIPGLLYY